MANTINKNTTQTQQTQTASQQAAQSKPSTTSAPQTQQPAGWKPAASDPKLNASVNNLAGHSVFGQIAKTVAQDVNRLVSDLTHKNTGTAETKKARTASTQTAAAKQQKLDGLRSDANTQLKAIGSDKTLTPAQRQEKAAAVIQQYFEKAKAAGFSYAAKPDGGTSLIDDAASDGGKYQVNLGASGHYDCTEAAVEAQKMFKEAGVDAKLNIVNAGGDTRHALLDLGPGKTFDPSKALVGGKALGGADKRPIEASFSQSEVEQLFDHGGSRQSALTEANVLHDSKAAQLKANYVAGPDASGSGTSSTDAVNDIKQKQSDYDSAKATADTYDKKLQDELNRVGPAMTDAQRQAYIKAFHNKYADVYSKVDQSAKALADSFKNNQQALIDAAGSGQAQDVYGALKDLASSPQGEQAVVFANAACADPNSPSAAAFRGSGFNMKQDVLVPGCKAIEAGALSEHPGDVGAAVTEAREKIEKLLSVSDFKDSLSSVRESFGKLGEIQKILGDTSLDAKTRYSKVEELLRGDEGSSPFASGIGALGLACSAAAAQKDGSEGQYLAMTKDIAETFHGGAELLKDNAKIWGEALKIANVGTKVGEVAAKLVPYLGLATNALSVAVDVSRLNKDSNLGDGVQLLGDMIATMGSAIAVIPGAGTVVGEAVDGIGTAISIGGGWLSDAIHANQDRAEEKDLLSQSVPSGLVDSMLNANPDDVRMMLDPNQGGLSVNQLQDLMQGRPRLMEYHDAMHWLVEMKKDYGMTGDQLDTMMGRMCNTSVIDPKTGNQVQDYTTVFHSFGVNMNEMMTNAEQQNSETGNQKTEGQLMRSCLYQLEHGGQTATTTDPTDRQSRVNIFSTVAGFLDQCGVPGP